MLPAFHSLWVGNAGGELLRSSPPVARRRIGTFGCLSHLRLVWGFSCQGVSARRRTSFLSFFVRSESRSFVPTRASPMSSRAGAVQVGRRTNLTRLRLRPTSHV